MVTRLAAKSSTGERLERRFDVGDLLRVGASLQTMVGSFR
jgi:hypothetical protein